MQIVCECIPANRSQRFVSDRRVFICICSAGYVRCSTLQLKPPDSRRSDGCRTVTADGEPIARNPRHDSIARHPRSPRWTGRPRCLFRRRSIPECLPAHPPPAHRRNPFFPDTRHRPMPSTRCAHITLIRWYIAVSDRVAPRRPGRDHDPSRCPQGPRWIGPGGGGSTVPAARILTGRLGVASCCARAPPGHPARLCIRLACIGRAERRGAGAYPAPQQFEPPLSEVAARALRNPLAASGVHPLQLRGRLSVSSECRSKCCPTKSGLGSSNSGIQSLATAAASQDGAYCLSGLLRYPSTAALSEWHPASLRSDLFAINRNGVHDHRTTHSTDPRGHVV